MATYNGDISISANFQLNINKPLDARTVIDTVSDLASISFKYQGMLVYIKNDDKYYSYNGTVWSELNTGGSTLTAGNGLTLNGTVLELGGILTTDVTIDTDGFLLNFDVMGVNAIDISNTFLNDINDGSNSINWTNRSLYNPNGVELLNWYNDNLQTFIEPVNDEDITNKSYVDNLISYNVNSINNTINALDTYVNENLFKICPNSVLGTDPHTSTTYIIQESQNFIGDVNTANNDISVQIKNVANQTGDVIYLRCGIPNATTLTNFKINITGSAYNDILYQNEWIIIRYNGTKWERIATNKVDYSTYSKEFQEKIPQVTIVVDAVNGNDSTAEIGVNCYNKPFLTITQANFKASGKDVILVKPGTYVNDYNIIPKSGITILMLENAIIQPVTTIIPIFTDLWTTHNNFTLLGKGKILTWGDMRNDQTSIYANGSYSNWFIELAELGSAQMRTGYFTERMSKLKIRNTKILGYVGNYAKASELILEKCVFENSMLQNMYMEAMNQVSYLYPSTTAFRKYPHPTLLTGKKITFDNCTFIKNTIIPPMYAYYTGTREDYTDWNKNDLDNISYRSYQRNPNQGWSDSFNGTDPTNVPPVELTFISCDFINSVGGNGITLFINPATFSNNRAFVSIHNCRFYLTNTNNPTQTNPQYAITTFGNDDSTTRSYYFSSNTSNVGISATAPTVLTNQLQGTGFTVNPSFTI